MTRLAFLLHPRIVAVAGAAFIAGLTTCAPVSAQQAPKPDPCAAPERAVPGGLPGQPADPSDACRDEANRKKGVFGRYGDIPGPRYLLESRPDFSETMAPAIDPKLRAQQRLRTAHRINRQGIQTAQRGEWAAALRLFEIAAGYAPRDAVIRANIAHARREVAREAVERRRLRLGR